MSFVTGLTDSYVLCFRRALPLSLPHGVVFPTAACVGCSCLVGWLEASIPCPMHKCLHQSLAGEGSMGN